METNFVKSRPAATMEITIHEEKTLAISHFTGKKQGLSRVTNPHLLDETSPYGLLTRSPKGLRV